MPSAAMITRKQFAIFMIAACAAATGANAQSDCTKPVYLTMDTGHMGIAQLVADVLKRQHVKVTFFAANEPTQVGEGSLSDDWAPWWKARAAEGHESPRTPWTMPIGAAMPARQMRRPSASGLPPGRMRGRSPS